MKSREVVVTEIQQMAGRMRRTLLDMALAAGSSSSHFGGGLSIVEITATLFRAVMAHDPANPNWSGRDRFILSKGHGCLGYYTALADAGYLTADDLNTFEKTGGCLPGHPVMNRDKGIEFSNGSLGMGLSLGIGVALAAKKRSNSHRVFVIMGDGECNEGAVWEAAMAAAHFKLDNIIAIVDRNRLQQTGANADIMSVGDVASKWRSFGWDVVELDGHDVPALLDAFQSPREAGKPFVIVAHTIKGKGFSFAENNNDWHHAMMTKSQYDSAVLELLPTTSN